jgi:Tfp pilus assembly pilus retraction ATPase PilT
MQTMDLALERLVRAGTISAQAAVDKAEDKESFKKLFPQLSGSEPDLL